MTIERPREAPAATAAVTGRDGRGFAMAEISTRANEAGSRVALAITGAWAAAAIGAMWSLASAGTMLDIAVVGVAAVTAGGFLARQAAKRELERFLRR